MSRIKIKDKSGKYTWRFKELAIERYTEHLWDLSHGDLIEYIIEAARGERSALTMDKICKEVTVRFESGIKENYLEE